jgi:uncharacterized protein
MASFIDKFGSEWKSKDPKQRVAMVAGAIALVLAVVGIFLPIVPQVPFAILAAVLFSKGSPRIHKWIRKNKYFGPPVRDWEDHRAVRPRLKILSTIMMVGGAGLGHWQLPLGWAIGLDAVFAAAIVFVLTRKSAD